MAPYIADTGQVGAADRRIHAGSGEVVESYLTWGFAGATEDAPIVEVDLFAVQDDAIVSITAMYGADLLRRHLSVDPTDLVRAYEAAWSSGDPDRVGSLYVDDATRIESLYGIELEGRDAIVADAAAFLERHRGASISVIEPYVFGDESSAGAVLVLSDGTGCDMEYTVVVETDGSGRIERERVYHDIGPITGCGWRR